MSNNEVSIENFKLLCAAVVEQAASDYRNSYPNSQEWSSAKTFFEGDGFEYYADALNFGLSGKDVLKVLDMQRTNSRQ